MLPLAAADSFPLLSSDRVMVEAFLLLFAYFTIVFSFSRVSLMVDLAAAFCAAAFLGGPFLPVPLFPC